jgi:hypothetical protein
MTVVGPYSTKIGYSGAFAYIAMLSFVPWWTAGLATHFVSRWWGQRFPLWLVAALGALAAGPAILVYASGVYVMAAAWWPSLPADGRFIMDIERWQAFALSQGRSVVLWIAFVVIFAETFGWKRYAVFDLPEPDLPAPDLPDPVAEKVFQLSGAPWTAEDDRQLHVLVADGLPPRAIASRMQRTFHAVRARTTKLGLKNNRP